MSIGQDALKTLSSQAAKGLNLQQETVIKGVNDAFAGKPALDEQARNKALFDVSQRLYKNIDKLEQQTRREGKTYQQKFAAQKGVALKEGIYSRIDYPGKGKVGENDIVTVVIKESLIDGTVINDMEAEDKIWSQALSQYPPTFREPLKRLNNHGAITIVVPPERAYGSKGIPGKFRRARRWCIPSELLTSGSTAINNLKHLCRKPHAKREIGQTADGLLFAISISIYSWL